jgi:hypothetical protein
MTYFGIALTAAPTSAPTDTPTSMPTAAPTEVPTLDPTATPTGTPTGTPTASPTHWCDDEHNKCDKATTSCEAVGHGMIQYVCRCLPGFVPNPSSLLSCLPAPTKYPTAMPTALPWVAWRTVCAVVPLCIPDSNGIMIAELFYTRKLYDHVFLSF